MKLAYAYRFEKILDVKENEKDQARANFEQSKTEFERVATKLYNLLKSKEEIIDRQEQHMKNGISVFDLKQHQYYLETLEKSISIWQLKVIEARNKMNIMESRLKDSNIEVKKYEKMKEKDFLLFMEQLKQSEMNQMDEISIQMFMNRARR